MNSKDIRNLHEAYVAVYNDDLRDELEEMLDDFEGIEDLSEEEIYAIVEDTIFEMIEEGYEFDEVEEIFEEVLSEARVDMAARAAARKQYAQQSEKSAREARSRGAAVVRKERRAEKIAQVKDAVKSTLSKAKQAIKSGASSAKSVARKVIDEPARKYAEKRGVVPSKSGKTALGSGSGIQSVSYKQRTPEGRREVRARVASDIKSRVGGKIQRAVQKAKTLGAGAASAAASAPSAVTGAAKQAASGAKQSVKGRIGRAALGVAKRMGVAEEVDVYDIVLEHLISEGFADTEESATVIMANMSEDWRNQIIESHID